MTVALCRANLVRLGLESVPALRAACEQAGAKLEIRQCLDRCQTCSSAAIALVDGAFVGAPAALELAEAIAGMT